MRKKNLLLFILFSLILYPKSYTLDDFIDSIKKKGYYSKQIEFQEKEENISWKNLELGDWNGINTSSSFSFNTESDAFTNSNSASYGYFDYNLSYNFDDEKVESHSLSVSKKLNDFVMDENKYDKKVFEYSKIKNNNTLTKSQNNEIISLINNYFSVLSKQIELEQKKLYLKEREIEMDVITKKVEAGKSKRIDLDLITLNVLTAKKEIEILKIEMDSIKKDVFNIAEIDYSPDSNFEFLLTSPFEGSDHVKKIDLDNIRIDMKQTEEELDFVEFTELPSFTASTKYDIENSDWTIGLTISKNFFNYSTEKENLYLKKEKEQYESTKLLKDIRIERENLLADYNNKMKEIDLLKEKLTYKEKEFEMHKQLYENGYMSFVDFNTKVTDLEDEKLNLKLKENGLNMFLYKLKYM